MTSCGKLRKAMFYSKTSRVTQMYFRISPSRISKTQISHLQTWSSSRRMTLCPKDCETIDQKNWVLAGNHPSIPRGSHLEFQSFPASPPPKSVETQPLAPIIWPTFGDRCRFRTSVEISSNLAMIRIFWSPMDYNVHTPPKVLTRN